jgi:hypothetical protein
VPAAEPNFAVRPSQISKEAKLPRGSRHTAHGTDSTLHLVKVLAPIVVALCTLAGWSASAEASPPCTVRGHVIAGVAHSRVISTKGEVVVYSVRRESEQQRVDTVWACERKHDRRVRVGFDESLPIENLGEGHVPNKTLEHVQIAGPWILATQTEEEDEDGCFKYELSTCNGPRNTLVIADAAQGLTASVASIRDYVEEPSRLGYVKTPARAWVRTLLSPQGGLAWVEEFGAARAISLHGCLAKAGRGRIGCAMPMQAEGAIEPGSVRLSGTTLTWMAAGSAQAVVL